MKIPVATEGDTAETRPVVGPRTQEIQENQTLSCPPQNSGQKSVVRNTLHDDRSIRTLVEYPGLQVNTGDVLPIKKVTKVAVAVQALLKGMLSRQDLCSCSLFGHVGSSFRRTTLFGLKDPLERAFDLVS